MKKRDANERRADQIIENVYRRRCNGRAINVMDIGKLFKDVKTSVLEGIDVEDAVEAAIVKYEAKV